MSYLDDPDDDYLFAYDPPERKEKPMGALSRITPNDTTLAVNMDAASIVSQRQAIVACMAHAMVKDVDYGKIPGTPKNTLYKPGSEKLLSMFNISAEPLVEDLSTPDTIRYRVTCVAKSIASGKVVGYGVGEASSAETKYQWRAAVCDQEWNEAPPNRRRAVWKKGSPAYQVKQVRAEMEDVANTVLKMAKKRAQIDMTLTVTAASDVFSQDLEDMQNDIPPDTDDGGNLPAEHYIDGAQQGSALPEQLERRTQAAQTQRPAQQQRTAAPASSNGPVISEAQGRRFYAKSMNSRHSQEKIKAKLQEKTGSSDSRKMPASMYDVACKWVDGEVNW